MAGTTKRHHAPDFASPGAIHTFATCPLASVSSSPPASEGPGTPSYLLAQVKSNMTISSPTLIVTDSAGADFALTYADPAAAVDLSAARAGHTVVLPVSGASAAAGRVAPDAERAGAQGFVRVAAGRSGEVVFLPARLDRALELGRSHWGGPRGDDDDGVEEGRTRGAACACCGRVVDGLGQLKACTGCAVVAYCDKVSKPWGRVMLGGGGYEVASDC